MKTGPHNVFDMKVGKKLIFLILFILFWMRKDCFIYSEKKTISCSLDPTTNSETRKLKIQDFFGSTSIQAWQNKGFETKNTISIQKSKRSVLTMINYVPTALYQLYARQSTAMWCHIDRNHDYKTNVHSSLPVWSTSSVQVVKKFDCWTPSIRIWVSRTNSHCWKRQFFYGISQCLEYCNNWAVIPC